MHLSRARHTSTARRPVAHTRGPHQDRASRTTGARPLVRRLDTPRTPRRPPGSAPGRRRGRPSSVLRHLAAAVATRPTGAEANRGVYRRAVTTAEPRTPPKILRRCWRHARRAAPRDRTARSVARSAANGLALRPAPPAARPAALRGARLGARGQRKAWRCGPRHLQRGPARGAPGVADVPGGPGTKTSRPGGGSC
jgi:hypothetical protein